MARGQKSTTEQAGVKVKVKLISSKARIPEYQTEGASAFDLHVWEGVVCLPGAVELVRTGIAVEVPPGYEVQIRPRSGLAIRNHIMVVNSPGTIDSDYRGEIVVGLLNMGLYPYAIEAGSRIAQGVLAPVAYAVFSEAKELTETARGAGGLGSTGK